MLATRRSNHTVRSYGRHFGSTLMNVRPGSQACSAFSRCRRTSSWHCRPAQTNATLQLCTRRAPVRALAPSVRCEPRRCRLTANVQPEHRLRLGRTSWLTLGANALLSVSPSGLVNTVAVFPWCPTRTTDSVATVVAVGPDGAYYAGELSGTADAANIYRVAPRQAPKVFPDAYCSAKPMP